MSLLGGYGQNGGSGMSDLWRLEMADVPVWSRGPDTPLHPGSTGLAGIFDPVADRVLVFGSGVGSNTDLWASGAGGNPPWADITPPGAGPAYEEERGAAYDPLRNRMLLTGYAPTGRWDVWELTLDGTSQWTDLGAATPSPVVGIWGNSTVFDVAGDQLIVLGGIPTAQAWALRFSPTPHWQLLSSTPGPATRVEHAVAFDSRRRRILVSGGSSGGSYLSDLWEFHVDEPGSWRLMAPTGPSPLPRGFHSMTYDASHDCIVFFGGHDGDYLQDTWFLRFDEPTGTRLTVVVAAAGVDHADLEWDVVSSEGSDFRVERREPSLDWMSLAHVVPDGMHRLRFHDARLAPDTPYAYRLAWNEAGYERAGGEVGVRTAPGRLALGGVHPNPVSATAHITMTTASTRPVLLQVLDITGRSMKTVELTGLEAGDQRIAVDLARVAAGIYWVRVSQGGTSLARRFAVVR
jgi:hypothetical protein